MKFTSDIDIDFADRDQLLQHIKVTPASMIKDGFLRKHNTGVYPQNIPVHPFMNLSSLDYTEAEDRGYVKLDFLNVWVYKLVKNEEDLVHLMREPNWELLNNREFFSKLVHVGNHYDSMKQMPEPINSDTRMAMFLALIRPGKKHLLGKTWAEVAKEIWLKDDTGYSFKKSHAIAYSNLVKVHMNLLEECRGELEETVQA